MTKFISLKTAIVTFHLQLFSYFGIKVQITGIFKCRFKSENFEDLDREWCTAGTEVCLQKRQFCFPTCNCQVCVFVCVWARLVKWNYAHRWKGQAHWPGQTGRQLVWLKNAWKKRKGHFIQYFLKKLKIPSERQTGRKESSEFRASAVPLW